MCETCMNMCLYQTSASSMLPSDVLLVHVSLSILRVWVYVYVTCIHIHFSWLHNFLNICIMHAFILIIGSSVFVCICCCCYCCSINYGLQQLLGQFSFFLFAFSMHSGRITYGAAFLDKLKWLTFIAVADSECYDFNAPEKDHC